MAIVIAGLVVAIIVAAVLGGHDYVEAAAFVIRAAGMQGLVRSAAKLEAEGVSERDVIVAWRGGGLRGREYIPDDVTGRAILLVPGVHAAGIEEPRLIGFARDIGATGHPVVTVELPDLARYSLTTRTTDMIEDGARWLSLRWGPRMPGNQRPVGIMGISFAGGLSIVAASRLGSSAAWVLSFGGHGDLPRTLRYLCTGVQADGISRPPHDYGVVIILLGVADQMVPAEQVQLLREALLSFLQASHLDMVDKPKAAIEFARARTLTEALAEPARTYMTWVNTRDVAHLGPALLPHIGALAGDPALSPSRSPPPAATVYLLHGADDNVIPAVESFLLAEDLRRRGALVEQLATPLITHAEVDRTPSVMEVWKLVRFWAGPL